jgi:hydroxypyruvate isomerase
MKLGCMLYSLSRALADGTLALPQALRLIRECGGEAVDLMRPMGDRPLPEIRQMVADAGIAVSSHIGGADLAHNDPALRTQGIDACRRVIDEACELGTDIVLLTTGGCAEGQDKAEGRRHVASALAEVLPYARERGVTVTIEDFGSPRAPYQTAVEVIETCELAGPDLMVTYDTGNMVMGDEDPVDFLRIVAPRVRHCHAKDWELLLPDAETGLVARSGKRYVGTVVGKGVLHYPAIIAALKRMSYEGYVSFEYEGRGDPIAAAREGMAYLARLMEA